MSVNNISMLDTMRSRQSIRTFDTEAISEEHFKQINNYIEEEQNFVSPFGLRGYIELIPVVNNVTDKGIKLGTYGFIKNPRAYLVGMTENNKDAIVQFGYVFQKLVIFLTQLGIGTCWMGGTFNRNSFEKEISLKEGQFIPCVTPIGYPKEKQRVFDKALRFVVKADNKKAWDKLFFDANFESPLVKEVADTLQIPIEMVRLGPSASNKQPWRLVLSKDRQFCHFYIEHTPNYSKSFGYDMQLLDMGIAMCQFELACSELMIYGEWLKENPALAVPNNEIEYIVSWKFW
ncbi:nitroreductase family protein [Evansella sp. AB-rgal1]|uniref:nitroreductase family protein n=1 Tax=Evansella sp. AB-rgal1 TaxID=3242696 RepID=UPI00359E5111